MIVNGPNTHTLVVGLPPADDDWPEITIECSGESGTCWAWISCENHKINRRVRENSEGVIHGVWHQRMAGYWMVESGKCSLSMDFFDWWHESAYDAASILGEGRHEIDFDWIDEHSIEIIVPEQVA